MHRITLTLLFTLYLLSGNSSEILASDIKTIKGEATWYDDGTMSRIDCMRHALESARINALAKNFGTIVSQNIIQSDVIRNDRETNDFLSLSATEVKGEWISDDGEPEYEFSRDSEQNLIVTCRVKGKARAISNEEIAFKALVLRNGNQECHADTHFKDGDEMKLLFNAASDGYLNVYLQDANGVVFCLLPYPRDSKSEVRVKKDHEYLFFSRGNNDFGPAEEVILTAPENVEYNRFFVLFSPRPFSRPVMQCGEEGIPKMNSDEFSKWLVKTRRNDSKLGVKAINIIIQPKNSSN